MAIYSGNQNQLQDKTPIRKGDTESHREILFHLSFLCVHFPLESKGQWIGLSTEPFSYLFGVFAAASIQLSQPFPVVQNAKSSETHCAVSLHSSSVCGDLFF
jgi:hypothetical protein